jgi:hypothetical protein
MENVLGGACGTYWGRKEMHIEFQLINLKERNISVDDRSTLKLTLNKLKKRGLDLSKK